MQVELMTMTNHARETIFAAISQCYSPGDAIDMFRAALQPRDETRVEFENSRIFKVLGSGHTSTIEHVSLTFAVIGVSRALTHQLVRHRIASYSQQSQRYVAAGEEIEMVKPRSIDQNKVATGIWDSLKLAVEGAYSQLVQLGIPKEDARFVLPNATASKIVVTMNCRALYNFFEERCCARAQWEIRVLANAMLEIARDELPVIFKNVGAKCQRLGYCPEEKSCGLKPQREDVMMAWRIQQQNTIREIDARAREKHGQTS